MASVPASWYSATCVLEEVGWRGYLQNALDSLPDWQRFGLVGLLWYGWHLSFLSPTTTIGRESMFLAVMVLGSLGLGKVAADTRSALVVAGFHLVVNVLFLSSVVPVPFARKLLLVGGCILLWTPILWGWPPGKIEWARDDKTDPDGVDSRAGIALVVERLGCVFVPSPLDPASEFSLSNARVFAPPLPHAVLPPRRRRRH
ncbi:CPBP family glutamic-type intramembrane protease [Salinibacter sp.]|uniref:CPBP family glutamic-type intramembrane protease n=1 Tax=Salinibacter sp. TaxID=2065818 RepID=UPI003D75932F